ncbi:hypothetical protein GCM10009119_22370 [Algoriphagus jejuensis]|uniref:Uncharacterized protein n=1 Tax=Algoriphagus jejuensis TaxID=419934 RepID=A0ABN1N130_9BACT
MPEAWIKQMVVEHLVIGDEEKAFTVFVQTADRIHIPGKIAERGQCGPLSAELCQNPEGLIYNEVASQIREY